MPLENIKTRDFGEPTITHATNSKNHNNITNAFYIEWNLKTIDNEPILTFTYKFGHKTFELHQNCRFKDTNLGKELYHFGQNTREHLENHDAITFLRNDLPTRITIETKHEDFEQYLQGNEYSKPWSWFDLEDGENERKYDKIWTEENVEPTAETTYTILSTELEEYPESNLVTYYLRDEHGRLFTAELAVRDEKNAVFHKLRTPYSQLTEQFATNIDTLLATVLKTLFEETDIEDVKALSEEKFTLTQTT